MTGTVEAPAGFLRAPGPGFVGKETGVPTPAAERAGPHSGPA